MHRAACVEQQELLPPAARRASGHVRPSTLTHAAPPGEFLGWDTAGERVSGVKFPAYLPRAGMGGVPVLDVYLIYSEGADSLLSPPRNNSSGGGCRRPAPGPAARRAMPLTFSSAAKSFGCSCFWGHFRASGGTGQHLHPPHTQISRVKDGAVPGWTARNQGNEAQAPLLEMFAYVSPQAGRKAKITSSENRRGWGGSGQGCLGRAERAPSCAWASLPCSLLTPVPLGSPFGATLWGRRFWITLLESPFWSHPFGVTHPLQPLGVTLLGSPTPR